TRPEKTSRISGAFLGIDKWEEMIPKLFASNTLDSLELDYYRDIVSWKKLPLILPAIATESTHRIFKMSLRDVNFIPKPQINGYIAEVRKDKSGFSRTLVVYHQSRR
ncbi:hypothetical protein PFISCL1PPCAC_11219, partial [Pristionchus fissidentatus]